MRRDILGIARVPSESGWQGRDIAHVTCHVSVSGRVEHVTSSRFSRELSRRWHPQFSVTITSFLLTIEKEKTLRLLYQLCWKRNILWRKKFFNKKNLDVYPLSVLLHACVMLTLSRSLSDWREAASEHPSPSPSLTPPRPELSSSGQWDLHLQETSTIGMTDKNALKSHPRLILCS